MNKSETAELIAIVSVLWPDQKARDLEKTVAVWQMVLEPFAFAEMKQALMDYSRGDNPFPPKPGQLIAMIANDAYDDLIPETCWAEIMDEVRNHPYGVAKIPERDENGQWRTVENRGPEFKHPLVAKTVAGIGWRTICQSEDLQDMQGKFFWALKAEKERAKTELQQARSGNVELMPSNVRAIKEKAS